MMTYCAFVDSRPKPGGSSLLATLAMLALAATSTAQAATFVVTSTANTNGPSCAATCSLREAINAANNNPGADNIHFNIAGSGVQVIAVASGLPALLGPTLIDGYTQPGSSANTLAVGSNASILIRVTASNFASAFTISGGNSTLRGVSIALLGTGVAVTDTPGNINNTIEGVWIGLSADGLTGVPNLSSIGSQGAVNTSGLRIGGPTPQQRNVLVGGLIAALPVPAIDVVSNNAVIVNNYFDVNKNGTEDLSGSPTGVIALRAGVRIGGPTAAERNIVLTGVELGAESGTGVVVEGNYFGLGADGLTAMGRVGRDRITITSGASHIIRNNVIANSSAAVSGIVVGTTGAPGIQILGNWIGLAADGVTARPVGTGIRLGSGAIGTMVGGSADSDGNLIANSLTDGILIDAAVGTPIQILGNTIGLNALGQAAGNAGSGIRIINNASGVLIGAAAPGAGNEIAANGTNGIAVISGTGNRITGNSIHDNLGLEVDLGNGTIADGANVNDGSDVDSGGNTRLNHPSISTATRVGNQITANINFITAANQSGLSIEFYRSPNCDNVGGLGQARRSVFTSSPQSSNGAGAVSASIPFTDADQTPAFYSAMLTDANGNTSEITPCVAVPIGLMFLDSFE